MKYKSHNKKGAIDIITIILIIALILFILILTGYLDLSGLAKVIRGGTI